MIAGIVPANDLASAKSRLKGFLNVEEREELVLYMLRRVLRALAGSRVDTTFLVTRDPALRREAEVLGAKAVSEPASLGPSRAVDIANRAAVSNGYEATLVVMSDLPAIGSHDVDEVVAAGLAQGGGVVACRSIRGGTNALWRMPPLVIPSKYGENSFINHRREARKARVPFRQFESRRISLDLDAPEDVSLLLTQIKDSEVASHLRCVEELMKDQGKEESRWQDRE